MLGEPVAKQQTEGITTSMAEAKPINYADNIKKYTSNVDEDAIKGIVRHLGIALRNKDSSLVAASDPTEVARVRDGFMKKKLALTAPDSELDAALRRAGCANIADVHFAVLENNGQISVRMRDR